MNAFHTREWRPIEDLPSDWQSTLAEPQTEALVAAWLEQAKELADKELYERFLEKLRRQWAIETGFIEGLYDIDAGSTLVLVEKGLDATYVSHGPGNAVAHDALEKIKDQYEAIAGLYQFVGGERPLTAFYIRELHQVLTAHQPTYEAVDTLGHPVTRELPRGIWKSVNNHVCHADGSRFEYCPYEHVQSEIDRLLAMARTHEEQGVPPEVEAAWLHHRFSLIHPFTDGNGRVSRCLATLVLLRSHWLPLVITRDDRDTYIAALRKADSGDLKPLVRFICFIERRELREAFALSGTVIREQETMNDILRGVQHRIATRRDRVAESLGQMRDTATALHGIASTRLAEMCSEIDRAIGDPSLGLGAFVAAGEPDHPNRKHNYVQIVACAKKMGYFANFHEFQSWVSLNIQTDHRTDILLSFHGIGKAPGVMGCAAMIYERQPNDEGGWTLSPAEPLSREPFEFARAENPEHVIARFQEWLQDVTLRGLHIWRETV